jgi:oligopeptide transport system ATP-binding protein
VPRLHPDDDVRSLARADRRLFEFHGDTTKEKANVA